MAPLFGPLASAGANPAAFVYAAPAYGAPAYAPAPVQPDATAYGNGLVPMNRLRGPLRVGPPIRIGDSPTPADPSSPAGMMGWPYTHLDRFFGPFASFSPGAGGISGL